MSLKDATKKGIIPTIVGKFSSSKDQQDVSNDNNNNKSTKNERKKRPTSMLSSKSFHRANKSSGELLKGFKNKDNRSINTSDWVESMEFIKDKGMTKKKKKKFKKKNGIYLPALQPTVHLKHAPSIAVILSPKGSPPTEVEVLHKKLRQAYQEIATLRALLNEKERLISLLTSQGYGSTTNTTTDFGSDDDSRGSSGIIRKKEEEIEKQNNQTLRESLLPDPSQSPPITPTSDSSPDSSLFFPSLSPSPFAPASAPSPSPSPLSLSLSIPNPPVVPKIKLPPKLRSMPTIKHSLHLSPSPSPSSTPPLIRQSSSPDTHEKVAVPLPLSKSSNSISSNNDSISSSLPSFIARRSAPSVLSSSPPLSLIIPTKKFPPSPSCAPINPFQDSPANLSSISSPNNTTKSPPSSPTLSSTPAPPFNPSLSVTSSPPAPSLPVISSSVAPPPPPPPPPLSPPRPPSRSKKFFSLPSRNSPPPPKRILPSLPSILSISRTPTPPPISTKPPLSIIPPSSPNSSFISPPFPTQSSPLSSSSPSTPFPSCKSTVSPSPTSPSVPSPLSSQSPPAPFSPSMNLSLKSSKKSSKPSSPISSPSSPVSIFSSKPSPPKLSLPSLVIPPPSISPPKISLSPLSFSSSLLPISPASPHMNSPRTHSPRLSSHSAPSPRSRAIAALSDNVPLVSLLQEKKNVLLQIEASERNYLLQLSIIIEIFLKPLREIVSNSPKPMISLVEIKSIFSDIEALWSASKYFLESLGAHIRIGDTNSIGSFFLRIVDTFRVYSGYVQNYYKAVTTLNQCKQSSPAFVAFLKKNEKELKTGTKDIVLLLLCPVNRIHQFCNQLKMLHDATAVSDPSFHSLGIAHAKICHFAANLRERAKIIEAKHKVQTIQDAICGKFPSLVQSQRLFIMEGILDLLIPAPITAFSPRLSRRPPRSNSVEAYSSIAYLSSVSSSTTSSTPHPSSYSLSSTSLSPALILSKSFYCFLFNDLLVLTKQKKRHYAFKRMYDIKDLDVQSVKSEYDSVFQITQAGTNERIFTSPTKRDVWVANLEKCIKEAVEKDLLKRPAKKELTTSGGVIDFSTAEINLQEHLGSGGSGCRVEKCTVDGKPCAIKIMPLSEQAAITIENFVNEIKIIEQLHHTNIIEYLGHWHKTEPSELWLFMDYYPMSLADFLEKREGKHLGLYDIVNVALFVAKGMEFLHTQKPPIMHRDLKTANILLSLDENYEIFNAKITDFDTARIIYSDVLLHTSMGTPCYMAPEVMDISMMPVGTTYSLKADIYSFGMILVELMTMKPPYNELRTAFLLTQKILAGEPPALFHPEINEMKELVELINKCIAFQPENRPDASTVVKALKKMKNETPGRT